MSASIHTHADLVAALDKLVAANPSLRPLTEVAGPLPSRQRPAGFAGLASIVVAQQLSTASAAAIWARLQAAFDPFDHRAVLRARAERLSRLGLSGGKIRTLKALARAVDRGLLDLKGLAELPADEAHRALVAHHGIGPWTADIYLLFCLGHADAWPAGDLALQEAMRIAFALPERPDAKQTTALAEPWRPWRGVAACLLWSYYRAIKGRDGVPINPFARA